MMPINRKEVKGMKRSMLVFLVCLAVLGMLGAGCGEREAPAVDLPEVSEIALVTVEREAERAVYTDPEWIGKLVAAMEAAEPTARQSIQDAPNENDLISVHLTLEEGGGQTWFFYRKAGRYFLERPYQGIYRTGEELCDILT